MKNKLIILLCILNPLFLWAQAEQIQLSVLPEKVGDQICVKNLEYPDNYIEGLYQVMYYMTYITAEGHQVIINDFGNCRSPNSIDSMCFAMVNPWLQIHRCIRPIPVCEEFETFHNWQKAGHVVFNLDQPSTQDTLIMRDTIIKLEQEVLVLQKLIKSIEFVSADSACSIVYLQVNTDINSLRLCKLSVNPNPISRFSPYNVVIDTDFEGKDLVIEIRELTGRVIEEYNIGDLQRIVTLNSDNLESGGYILTASFTTTERIKIKASVKIIVI